MLGQQQQHQHSERRSGSRRRRRGRSGEGIVKANRKTEICLHWRNGSCPYGAGSCAFAHGLGELRHPTMDDDTIIDSVSEDSGSCPPSPRDPSPSRRPRQHSRDRRLPTFVHLSAGNTPEVRPFAALSSTPAASHGSGVLHESHRGRQRERSHPWPSSSDDDVRVRSALIEPPTPAPISTAGAQFPEGDWGVHPGRNLSTSTAGRPMSEIFTTAYGGCIEDRHHRTPSATSHATPNPFRQPLMVHPSQKPQQAGWGEGGAPVGPTSQHQRTFPHPGAGRSAWW